MAPRPASEQARLRKLFGEQDPEATNSLGMRFRLIFPGTIETRAGTASIKKPFYLGACEVTQAEYEKVTGENPSHFRGANLPADSINWDEALAFCRRLSEIEGAEYRLPTEAEWDYACRADATSRLCWAAPDVLGDHAWVSSNSGQQTHPVGLKTPNAWGLHDMHGNVWEWCQVVPGAYAKYAAYSRALPGTLRGGSWAEHNAGHCELGHSFDSVPGNRLATNGFRVVRSLP
jgi:formylglycine-generating enzyme required for sulfatase activity